MMAARLRMILYWKLKNKIQVMQNIRISNDFGGRNGSFYSLGEVADLIKNDEITKRYTNALRDKNVPEELHSSYKAQLKKCEFASVCNGERKIANIQELTGYLVVDIDEDGVDYEHLRQQLISDNELNPVLLFTSPSGKMKFVIRLMQLEHCQLKGQEASDLYGKYYRQMVIYMVDRYGVTPDLSCSDGVRLCYMSHDDNPFYAAGEPYCDIKFYDVDDELVVERYGLIASDVSSNVRPQRKLSDDDFDRDMYIEKVKRLCEDIVIDEKGDYVYDKEHKETIGSRSGGTAKTNIDGASGYALKWRLNVAVMWMFGGDIHKAQRFIDTSFTDARDPIHVWNPCSKEHLKYSPCWNVVLWIIETFGFKTLHTAPVTEMKYMDDFVDNMKHGDVTIAGRWDDIMREYGLPKMLDKLMRCLNCDNPKKDVTLYSFLTLMSGFAKRQEVCYNEGVYGLNLFLNVLGSAASGKSAMGSSIKYLLPSLNFAANEFNKNSYANYKIALAEYEKSKKSKKKQVDGQTQCDIPPEEPPKMFNTYVNSTANGFCRVLQENNGKFVFSNTEYSNLTKTERGDYGGMLSYFKNVFDNDAIGVVTDTGLRERTLNNVSEPNCSIMLSGTFGQFKALYPTPEDGLLSRSLYYILPTIPIEDYEYPDQINTKQNKVMPELELEFLQWHYWCALDKNNRRRWRFRDEDLIKFKAVMRNTIVKCGEIYCNGDEVSTNIQSFLMRFGHNVVRVAALLSSLSLFERNYYNPKYADDNIVFAQNPKLYKYDMLNNTMITTKEFTYMNYVEVQCGYPYSNDANECNAFNTVNECSYINYEYAVAALKILMPSLIYGVRMFEIYRKGNNILKNVNPIDSNPIYIAFQKCSSKFTFSDYKNVLSVVKGVDDINNTTVSRAIKRLCSEGFIEKNDNCYVKLKTE